MLWLFEKLWEALKRLGRWLRTKILNFVRNIKAFFLEKKQQELLKKRKKSLLVQLRKNLVMETMV